jgi:transposase
MFSKEKSLSLSKEMEANPCQRNRTRRSLVRQCLGPTLQLFELVPITGGVLLVLPSFQLLSSRTTVLTCRVQLYQYLWQNQEESAMKKYKVTLTADERQALLDLLAAGKAAALKLTHARILLKADAADGGPAWTDDRIAEAVEVNVATVERVRQRFVEQGLEAALVRKKQDRPSRVRKLDGHGEARLIALACSEPPPGRCDWTLRLLADKLVELQLVESIATETVRQVLKKTNSSRG